MPSLSDADKSTGFKGEPISDQENAARGGGAQSCNAPQDQGQSQKEDQAFRKLGDALERFHRQQEQIRDASEDGHDCNTDMDVDEADFEHLPNESARHDTQALGAATEDQAHALDESM